MQTDSYVPIETIRISEKEKEKLVWAVNQSPEINVGRDKKKLYVTPTHTQAVLSLTEKGSQPVDFSVVTYSYGRQGISVIHGRYIYPNTTCRVRFKSLSGKWHERTGKTGQCVHVQGMIHALLIVFDDPINLDEFATLTPEEETRHLHEISQELPHADTVEFSGLVSRVLFVDDQSSDRKLISFWLNRAGMEISTAASTESATRQMEDNNYDLLIVDMQLGDERGDDFIRNVRNNRFVQPVLAVSADHSDGNRESALKAGANAFLEKPFDAQALLSTMRPLLGFDEHADNGPIYSSFNNDDEMLPLLMGYVRSLPDKIQLLSEANANNDYETIERVSGAMKGSGSGYGLVDITTAASTVLNALDADLPDIDEIKRVTNSLINVLSRVKVRKLAQDESEGENSDTLGANSEPAA